MAHGTAFPDIQHLGSVVPPIHRDGDFLHQLSDIGVAATLLKLAYLLQLSRHQNEVHRPGSLPHGGDNSHDRLMRWQHKLLGRQRLQHAVRRAAIGDRRADHGFFGDLIFGKDVFHFFGKRGAAMAVALRSEDPKPRRWKTLQHTRGFCS